MGAVYKNNLVLMIMAKKLISGNIIQRRNIAGKVENNASHGKDISDFVEALEKCLDDKDIWVRISCAEALIYHYLNKKLDRMVERFLEHEDVEVRKLAATKLAEYYKKNMMDEEIRKMIGNEKIRRYVQWVVGTKKG